MENKAIDHIANINGQQPLVTVIVPIYNVEEFLPRCLNSVCGQSYPNLEILAVDDGSTDRSADIVARWAEKDSRVKLIRQENGGLSAARNAALDAMTGQYVTMVDGDDFIHPDMIARLLQYAGDHDIVICDWKRFSEKRVPKAANARGAAFCRPKIYSGESALRLMLYQRHGLTHSACARLFNADIFNTEPQIRFPKGLLYEDLAIIVDVMSRCRSVAFLPEKMYFYLQRDGSILHNFSARRGDVINILSDMEAKALAEGSPTARLLPAVRSRLLSAAFNMVRLIPPGDEYEQLRARCLGLIARLRAACLADRNVRLRNRVAALLSCLLGTRLTALLLKRLNFLNG